MKQLSGVDASFLNMETPAVYGHVASMTIYDPEGAPGGAGVEATKQVILERIDELAPFRRRLVQVPLGLDLPYWIEDPDFDIDYHVRHHAVPPPGSPKQLAEVVSRIHARPLDRSRPLWELYVIEGVDGGTRIAQVTKVHHATIDGASGALMLAAILDTEPDARHEGEAAAWTPDRVPTDIELLQRTFVQYARSPEKFIRLSVKTLRDLSSSTGRPGLRALADVIAQPLPGPLGNVMRRRLRGSSNEVDDPPALPPTPAPRTPWNATVTPHRRFSYTTIPLEDAKKIRRAVGCTFNDVVMALCSGALRQYLIEHDCLPPESLIAAVPVSVRSGSEDDMYQNRVSMLLADLATNEPDPAGPAAADPAEHDDRQDAVRGHPCRVPDGLHAVRSAGDRGAGDADVQPDAHRRPYGAAVQPDHLQRAGTSDAAVLRRRPAGALLSDLGGGRWPGPEHDGAELQRQPRLRLRCLP